MHRDAHPSKYKKDRADTRVRNEIGMEAEAQGGWRDVVRP
jgi:hypothetical protein